MASFTSFPKGVSSAWAESGEQKTAAARRKVEKRFTMDPFLKDTDARANAKLTRRTDRFAVFCLDPAGRRTLQEGCQTGSLSSNPADYSLTEDLNPPGLWSLFTGLYSDPAKGLIH